MSDPIEYSVDDGVARLVLNRPDALNAVTLETVLAIRHRMQEADSNPEVRVVLISGQGRLFCAGADLRERKGKDADWVRARRQAGFAAYSAIDHCSKPVVTLVHGACVGAGGEIALAGDFIVASDDARFRWPEPQWGTVGGTQRLQRIVGLPLAKDMLFTGRWLSAQEALTAGMVSRVVPVGELAATGDAIAVDIINAAGLAISLTKQAMDLGATTDLASGIRIEMSAIDQNLASGDWQSGLAKFDATVGKGSKKSG